MIQPGRGILLELYMDVTTAEGRHPKVSPSRVSSLRFCLGFSLCCSGKGLCASPSRIPRGLSLIVAGAVGSLTLPKMQGLLLKPWN